MSFHLRTCVSIGMSIDTAGHFFFRRDGDTAEIRMEADGMKLHIRDNHVTEKWDNLPAVQEQQ